MIQLDIGFTFAGPNYVAFYPNYWAPRCPMAEDVLFVMHSKVVVGDTPRLVSTTAQYIEEYGQQDQNFPHTLAVQIALQHSPSVWVLTVSEDVPLDMALWKLADSDYPYASYLAECLQTICPRKDKS